MSGLKAVFKSILARPKWPEITENTFVLWEPCSSSHGEVVPGYTKYLLDLGYDVLVLMTPERVDEGLFSRMPEGNFRLARLTQRQIKRFVKKPEMSGAEGILVTTAGKLPRKKDATPDLNKVFGRVPANKIYLVEHDARARLDANSWNENLITLKCLGLENVKSKVVNPHYFGSFQKPDYKHDKFVFLMVGAARAKRRSDDLVLNAAATLLEEGNLNFEIRMVGKSGSIEIPDNLKPYFNLLGRLSFSEMYTEVENSDVILTAFQKNNPDHAFYRTSGTSGSIQLAYGFHKPMIIQEQFTSGTALNSKNSFIYDEDEHFAACLRDAMKMDLATKEAMNTAMTKAASALYTSSLHDLKGLIRG